MLLIFLRYRDDALKFLRYFFVVFLVLYYILIRGSVVSSHIAIGAERYIRRLRSLFVLSQQQLPSRVGLHIQLYQ